MAAVSEFQFMVVFTTAVIAGGFLGWVLHAIHQAHKHLPEGERRPWVVFFGLLTLCLVVTTDARAPVQLSPADKMLAARTTPPLTIHQALDQCPPEGPGMTRQVIFTVETESDLHPRITGCVRIAEQQYLVKDKR